MVLTTQRLIARHNFLTWAAAALELEPHAPQKSLESPDRHVKYDAVCLQELRVDAAENVSAHANLTHELMRYNSQPLQRWLWQLGAPTNSLLLRARAWELPAVGRIFVGIPENL